MRRRVKRWWFAPWLRMQLCAQACHVLRCFLDLVEPIGVRSGEGAKNVAEAARARVGEIGRDQRIKHLPLRACKSGHHGDRIGREQLDRSSSAHAPGKGTAEGAFEMTTKLDTQCAGLTALAFNECLLCIFQCLTLAHQRLAAEVEDNEQLVCVKDDLRVEASQAGGELTEQTRAEMLHVRDRIGLPFAR